jgi:hypothetical protein
MAFIKYTQGNTSLIRESVTCSCESDEHQMNFRFFADSLDDEFIYCTISLVPEKNIFKRFWKAIKYLFGYKSKFGDFEEFILDKNKIYEIKNIIEYYEKIKKV